MIFNIKETTGAMNVEKSYYKAKSGELYEKPIKYFRKINYRDEYSVESLKLIRQHHKNCKTHAKGEKYLFIFQ